MFSRLFTPKWEHADPDIRRQALESGEAPAEAVAKAARDDGDPEVRRCAVGQLDDLELLAALAAKEPEPGVREVAAQRQRELLAGPLPAGMQLDARLAALHHARSPALCVFLVRHAQLAEIREAALEQVDELAVLCTVAVEDPVAAIRRAALERVYDPQGWEQVAREARNRDKQISRLARERLEAWKKARADHESAEQLCGKMEGLLTETLKAGDQQRLRRLDVQWEQLESGRSAELVARYGRARELAAAEIECLDALKNARRAICADLEHLLADGSDAEGTGAQSADDLLASLETATEHWQALLPEADNDDPLAQQFVGLGQQVRQAAGRLSRDQACAVPLQTMIEKARVLLDKKAELDARRVGEFEQRWAALEQPASRPLAEVLQHDFDSALQALRDRLDRQRRQRMQAVDTAERLLTELATELQQGELEHALSLRNKVHHQLKIAKGVDPRRQRALQERLQGMQPRLEELRKWRHWGGGKARQQLCTEIEALADSLLGAEEVAARVRTARDAWKRIDRAEGPAGETLWQRFDQACTRAYEPYQREQREQAAQRAAHLEQKQALCQELDAFERDTDWKQVDWHAADQQVRKASVRWRRIGPVPGKARKALEKNYHAVLDRLESHLGAERDRELRRRRALIAEVEQLATATDWRAASRVVKQAQAQWKPAVQADRKVEQALWKQFRSACDAVFNHIGEQRGAADAEQQANLDLKLALCAELKALLENRDADFRSIARRFGKARSEWAGIGHIPRKDERAMQTRFEALEQQLVQRKQQEATAAAESVLKGLQARSRLCEGIEAELLEPAMDDSSRQTLTDETGQAWQGLDVLDARHEKALHERLELASRALGGDDQARKTLLDGLQDNLDKSLEHCLKMEIAAGIESPAEFAEARMRFQVSRLADAMHQKSGESQSPREQWQELQMAWYLLGPVPMEARGSLDMRFERVIASLKSS